MAQQPSPKRRMKLNKRNKQNGSNRKVIFISPTEKKLNKLSLVSLTQLVWTLHNICAGVEILTPDTQ